MMGEESRRRRLLALTDLAIVGVCAG
jgi:hypothetical protein